MKKQTSDLSTDTIEEATWEKKRKRISSVWIVPIVALIVGAWLIFESVNSKGPSIHIVFKSAEGVKANKTIIKYKDIEVGKVTNVVFNDDLSSVIVTAEMKKSMRPYLSENTKFWIMKARVGLNQVEGLETLLSGVYIVMDPAKGTSKIKEFKGLDTMPVISTDEKGTSYKLSAQNIGSIGIGSPVYYKKLNAGSITDYRLSEDGRSVNIEVFIRAPFDKLVSNQTRFWNASGFSAELSADGFELHTESLASILAGGLAFDNFRQMGKKKKVKAFHSFILYKSQKEAKKMHYSRELFFWIYSKSNVRGLSAGAPVEFRGVKIGEVVNFSLIGNIQTAHFEIPILVKVEPQRFMVTPKTDQMDAQEVNENVLKKLISKGMRAQLKSGNLITGELYIDLDMYENSDEVELVRKNGLFVLPSVPGTIEALKSDIKSVLDKMASIPFKEIGEELQLALKEIRTGTIPKLNETIVSTDEMMKGADTTMKALQQNYLDSNAEVNKKLIKMIDEMTRTSRSIKKLSDYLERHPESLIQGK